MRVANELYETLLEMVGTRRELVSLGASLLVRSSLTLVLILAGLAVARQAKRRVVRWLVRSRATGGLAPVLGQAVYLSVLLLTLLLILRLHGLDSAALVAIVGAGAVAIGLALQDILKNLFAGIYLLLAQPFRIGDTLVVDQQEGTVESVDLRATTLQLLDGTQALVPNVTVLTTTVLNRGTAAPQRLSLRVSGVPAEADAAAARIAAMLQAQPEVVPRPGPLVRVEAVESGRATLAVDVWQPAGQDAAPRLVRVVHAAFPEAEVRVA
jgi:small-conductance mechanosensitive channel